MSVSCLLGIARNCRDLGAASAFYRHACGCVDGEPAAPDALLMPLLRPASEPMRARRWLWRGRQPLLLLAAPAEARPVPQALPGNDLAFQHIAFVTDDITAEHTRWLQHGVRPISRDGPQQLPPESGGVTAFKGYDPEGHPIELLSFPPDEGAPATRGGIDHSAISVRDGTASIAFYQDMLGLDCTARQLNRGAEQDRLDDLTDTQVQVITLAPSDTPAPHVELLAYLDPPPQAPDTPPAPGDIAADHLLFTTTALEQIVARLGDGGHPILARTEDAGGVTGIATRDPDGHQLIILLAGSAGEIGNSREPTKA
ncbi:MAG: VOC family protein [Thiohalocapsa sp.]|uniref:VOC family protein n=1 Tax=Thiohalocapsa sp. TaxID=2497641 RepID=UPI0025F99722|nr:VOC family protein [Thiohalocapsa sp.]MCG6941822.1 VOC family protein [Thiohalocapsa sp.]